MTLRKKPFDNIGGKGENADDKYFLPCPQCFPPTPTKISIFVSHLFCSLQIRPTANLYNFDWSKFFSIGKEIIQSQTSLGFYMSAVQVFCEYCGKRRNSSLGAIYPFPKVFSTRLENFLSFSLHSKLSSFSVWKNLKFVIWERVK